MDWPHAPTHRLAEAGTYCVTAGTYRKQHSFREERRLDLLQRGLLQLAQRHQWQLEAWAIFSNHYHFVGHCRGNAESLSPMLAELHYRTAAWINGLDGTAGRPVWHNFWETRLTHQGSYLARLRYVHENAVHHGLVDVARQYRWCSASWFERTARPAQIETVYRMKIDRVTIFDDF